MEISMKYKKVKGKKETTKTFLDLTSTVQNIDVQAEVIQSLTPIVGREKKKFFVLIDTAREKKKLREDL
jgi:hypothetical protein